ncbi:glycine--tRNA ligase subunit beta [Sodalis-like secondary symbiont of Drepanosiphum platanoidis]|uniref:glycine--tRNA ligase subunit beta n=1 Tax=Sodalis-like secondary symbiont of Drepanosiphum platanoidis TaxID=2994493 RepID=UPI00346400B9
MVKNVLLIEIGTETLPYKSLKDLSKNFCLFFKKEIDLLKIKYKSIKWFATPKRFGIQIFFFNKIIIEKKIKKRGPKFSQAFLKNGNLTKATIFWIKKHSININDTKIVCINNIKWLMYEKISFKSIDYFLNEIISKSLKKLNKYKMMFWGERIIEFIRPINNITILIDKKIIKTKILGVISNNFVFGNCFIKNKKIIIKHANDYLKNLLEQGKVIANYKLRKKIILSKIINKAKKINGQIKINNNLLEEITSLVEWPNVLLASFKKDFLKIPNEIIENIIIFHKKYIPIYDLNKKLTSYFIFVINVKPINTKIIISEHIKVLESFLSDAKFFFKCDRKKKLEDYRLYLKNILFKENLGNLFDKSNRIQKLSCFISNKIGANIEQTSRAAFLSKCDLATKMVFEFPNISGIIGMYYAKYDNESDIVSLALKEQYYPRFSNDILPTTLVSCSLSIADKIDTLVGILENNNLFKKYNDPLGLKKITKHILIILIEKKISINLKNLIKETIRLYNNTIFSKNLDKKILKFIIERTKYFFLKKGYSIDIIESVLSKKNMNFIYLHNQIDSIENFSKTNKFSKFINIYKRINNFFIKNKEKINKNIFLNKLKEPEEIKLNIEIEKTTKKINNFLLKGNYKDILIRLSKMFNLIDLYFKNIVIMHKDIELRTNRINLLKKLKKLFLIIANISLLKNKNFKKY